MNWPGIPALTRLGATLRQALRGSVLSRPIGRVPDSEIDRALRNLGQTRVDLFTPAGAGAKHRIRMARMMAAHRIDVRRAVSSYWPWLKAADNYCRYCPSPARCQRWLDGDLRRAALEAFCPNARLFSELAAGQRERRAT
jgi:hypothetical protein